MRGSMLVTVTAVAMAWLGLAAIASEKPSAEFVKQMQTMNDAVVDLRTNVGAKDWPAVAKNAASLKVPLKATLTFWEKRKTADAVTHAQSALKAATDIETGAKAKDEKGVLAGQRALNAACNACHTAHREMTPDRKYLIK